MLKMFQKSQSKLIDMCNNRSLTVIARKIDIEKFKKKLYVRISYIPYFCDFCTTIYVYKLSLYETSQNLFKSFNTCSTLNF